MSATTANIVTAINRREREESSQARFDELFRLHQPRLVRSLTLMAGEREIAADAVQEAFIRAHQRWRRVERFDDPIGWVRRVAINRLKDEHRGGRRKRAAIARLSDRQATAVGHHEISLPDDVLTAHLAALSPQQRRCAVLHYVDDLSIGQIAHTLGVAEGTVKSNLSDARARLRSLIDLETP